MLHQVYGECHFILDDSVDFCLWITSQTKPILEILAFQIEIEIGQDWFGKVLFAAQQWFL